MSGRDGVEAKGENPTYSIVWDFVSLLLVRPLENFDLTMKGDGVVVCERLGIDRGFVGRAQKALIRRRRWENKSLNGFEEVGIPHPDLSRDSKV